LSVEWLFEKTSTATRRMVLRSRELMAAGNQYDRQSWPQVPDRLLKHEAVRTRHANVRYNAVDVSDRGAEELFHGLK
jgi:hypothetical protein